MERLSSAGAELKRTVDYIEKACINVNIDMKICISISIRPMTTLFGRHVHLEELTQTRLIKQVLVTSLR